MSQIDKIFGFESELKLSVLYSYTRRSIFAFVSGLKYGKRWHPNLYLLVSYLNPSLGTASEVGHASRWFDFHSQSQEHEHLHVALQATRCRGSTPWNLLSWRYRWHGQATRPAAPTRGRRPPPAFRPCAPHRPWRLSLDHASLSASQGTRVTTPAAPWPCLV